MKKIRYSVVRMVKKQSDKNEGFIMRAPSKAHGDQLVKIQFGQRLATSPKQNSTFREVTN
jgi:hypothetical protein